MKFIKPPLTLQDQINHIKNHYNLKCKNEKLEGIGFFFEEIKKSVYFEEVINLYEFDKSLNILKV
ncbi:MAG: hypothetical protein ABGX26_00380 [Nautiliaceae bacterium]